MFKRLITACVLLSLFCIGVAAFAQQKDTPKEAPKPRTLKIKLNYTGEGTVDEKHPIFVFVWDNPNFASGQAPPIFWLRGTVKDAALTIDDLGVSPVYVVAVFDKTGNYSGMEAPPSGASVTQYGGQTAAPITVEPGETITIDLPFDDSIKMP